MSSDGEDPFEDFIEEVTEDPIKAITNYATGGLLSLDKKGKFGKGASVRAVDEAVGEVTGRNKARQAAGEAAAAIEEERQARMQELSNQREAKRQMDLDASRRASGLRRRGPTKLGTSTSTTADTEETVDFLGL